ncbi:MAG: RluA family pseudouridine synthase [Patescibacteria group bacterium]
MEIKIIFEDEELIIIDKPAGVVVNNAESAKGETIQEWAEKRLGITNHEVGISNGEQSSEEEFKSRGGVVHRLDKETSGILLIAKNPQSFLALKNQFKERKVEKEYLALSHGEIKPENGEINAAVGRLPYNRTRFGVLAGGRDASTQYKVLSIKYFVSNGKKEPLSFLKLNPKTGRTHQIRVHLKYINHPIFADPLYAGRKVGREDRKHLSRLFLHASRITFAHPTSLKLLTFESLLPQDLQNFLSLLKSSYPNPA